MLLIAYIGPGVGPSSGWPWWVWGVGILLGALLVGLAAVAAGAATRRSDGSR